VAEQFGWRWSRADELSQLYPGLTSFLGVCHYLVLPVNDQAGHPVWFTARAMGDAPRAYLQPPGVIPVLWKSWTFIPRKKKSILAITEGIADAAFLSQQCDSIALCGIRYDGSLDYELRGRDIMVALDGDAPGYAASTVLGQQMIAAGARSVRLVAYAGKDPTDWTDADVALALA
jgi:DNA primase